MAFKKEREREKPCVFGVGQLCIEQIPIHCDNIAFSRLLQEDQQAERFLPVGVTSLYAICMKVCDRFCSHAKATSWFVSFIFSSYIASNAWFWLSVK